MADVVEKENIFLFVPNLIGELFEMVQFSRSFSITASWKLIFMSLNFQSTLFLMSLLLFFIYLFYFFIFFSGYARIILAIISFYFMQTHYAIAGWCYIISALLDAIDGHAARAFNQSKSDTRNHT